MLSSDEKRLIAILLVSANVSPAECAERFANGTIKRDLSGPIPTTVFRCGHFDMRLAPSGTGSVVAEMNFECSGKSIEWLLHQYPNNECEIEVLVNANLEPWVGGDFPKKIEVFLNE